MRGLSPKGKAVFAEKAVFPEKVLLPERGSTQSDVSFQVALLIVCALSLLSFGLGLFRIQAQSLWWDEALSYHRASGSIAYVLSNRITLEDVVTVDQHPPLYFLLLNLALRAFGQSELVMRFPSAVATVLLVPSCYLLGATWFNRRAGLAAAAISASSPYLAAFAQEARPYAQAALLSALSTAFLGAALKRAGWRWHLAWALTTLAAVYTHYFTVLVLAPEALLAAGWLSWQRRRWLPYLVPLALLAVPALACLAGRYASLPATEGRMAPTNLLKDAVLAISFGMATDLTNLLPYAVGVALLLLAGVWTCRRTPLSLALPGLLGATLAAYCLLAQSGRIPFSVRYLAPVVPLYFALLGMGISSLGQRRLMFSRLLPAVALVYLLVGSGYGLYQYYFVRNDTKQDFRGVASYISEHALPGDAVLLTSFIIRPAFDYYSPGGLPVYGFPVSSGFRHGSADADLADLASHYQRFWWVQAMAGQGTSWVQPKLEQLFSIVDHKTFVGSTYAIDLRLYQKEPYTVEAVPSDATELGVTFGGAVTAEAFAVGWADAEQSRLDVKVYWRAEQNQPRSANVFVQLVDSQGQAWGQSEREPFNGFHPMSSWHKGELVADRLQIEVQPGAPPGRYRLRLGVHQLGGGPALEASDKAGQPLGQHIEVGEIDLTLPSAQVRGAKLAGASQRAVFADELGLLQVGRVSERRLAGETLPLRLWWSVYKSPGQVEAWLQLADGKGSVVAQARLPLSGLYPSQRWQPGNLVGADYALRLPPQMPAGPYRLLLSIVPSGASQPLPVREGWWPLPTTAIDLGTVEVQQVPLNTTVPAEAQAVSQRFADGIELVALAVDSEWNLSRDADGVLSLQPSASPKPLAITLYWRAEQAIEEDYTVTVQLLDANGRLVDQDDGVPANGARPTSAWRPGEVIADQHALSKLASLPSGDYTLVVGLYQQPSLQRLLAADGKDHVLLARLKN